MGAAVVPGALGVVNLISGIGRKRKEARQAQQLQQQAAPSPFELQQQERSSAAGAHLAGSGQDLGQMGTAGLADVMGYYRKLAHGDQGAIQAAVAPERRMVTDAAAGARGQISRLAPGPMRDKLLADQARETSGRVADLGLDARARGMGAYGSFANAALESGTRRQATGAELGLRAGDQRMAGRHLQTGVGQQQSYLDLMRRQQGFEEASAVGESLGGMLQGVGKQGKQAPLPSYVQQIPGLYQYAQSVPMNRP